MEIVIEEEVEKKMRSNNKNKGPPPSSYGYANHSLRKYFPIPNRGIHLPQSEKNRRRKQCEDTLFAFYSISIIS